MKDILVQKFIPTVHTYHTTLYSISASHQDYQRTRALIIPSLRMTLAGAPIVSPLFYNPARCSQLHVLQLHAAPPMQLVASLVGVLIFPA